MAIYDIVRENIHTR